MKEEEFWDKLSNRIEKEYSIAGKVTEYESILLKKLGNVMGQRILDCGIGGGRVSKVLVEKGAQVFGFDCSSSMLNLTKRKVPPASLLKMKAEELGFKNEQFDTVIGLYILHHTALGKSIPGIARVLRKGGVGIFVENFGFNPLLNFVRNHLTGKFRIARKGSIDECPLNASDLKIIKKYFTEVKLQTDIVLFARLLARTFDYRSKILNYVTALFDKWLSKGIRGLRHYSYTQLLVVRK